MKVDRERIWLIEWHDAHSGNGWFSDEQVKKFIDRERCICYSVGWILSESKKEIVVAERKLKWREDEGDHEWGMLQKIPKAWIRKKVLLKLSKQGV